MGNGGIGLGGLLGTVVVLAVADKIIKDSNGQPVKQQPAAQPAAQPAPRPATVPVQQTKPSLMSMQMPPMPKLNLLGGGSNSILAKHKENADKYLKL